MSITMMIRADESDLPGDVRSVLLVVADQSGETGNFRIEDPNRFRAYVAWRTGLAEFAVADILNQLEDLDWLNFLGHGEFQLDLSEAGKKVPFEVYYTRPFDPDDFETAIRDAPFAGAAERLQGRKGRFSVPDPEGGGSDRGAIRVLS